MHLKTKQDQNYNFYQKKEDKWEPSPYILKKKKKKTMILCMECWNKKFHLFPRTDKISITNSYCLS